MCGPFSSLPEDTSLPVQSSKELRIATAIFPILSLLNHSCQPNTSISFNLGLSVSGPSSPVDFASGVTVTIRACRDIAAGQELLHCYGKDCLLVVSTKEQSKSSNSINYKVHYTNNPKI